MPVPALPGRAVLLQLASIRKPALAVTSKDVSATEESMDTECAKVEMEEEAPKEVAKLTGEEAEMHSKIDKVVSILPGEKPIDLMVQKFLIVLQRMSKPRGL